MCKTCTVPVNCLAWAGRSLTFREVRTQLAHQRQGVDLVNAQEEDVCVGAGGFQGDGGDAALPQPVDELA
jgi:hypothetical protein